MSENPNKLIRKRLDNIEERVTRITYLHSHLHRFKLDIQGLSKSNRTIEGVHLFYYYSFSQFILEINKLFDNDVDEYYTIPKLLNHIETNIKRVKWYHKSVTYQNPNTEELKTGKPIWQKGDVKECYEPAMSKDLEEKIELISSLKNSMTLEEANLEKIKLARDKVIAHLDKNFQKFNIVIELEAAEHLLNLAVQILNSLSLKLFGYQTAFEIIKSDAISTLTPIIKYYKLESYILSNKASKEPKVDFEELLKLIN
jgi:hypothetical protein